MTDGDHSHLQEPIGKAANAADRVPVSSTADRELDELIRRRFATYVAADLRLLRRSLTTRDLVSARRIAHGIRGSASLIDVAPIARLAADVEIATNAASPIDEVLTRFAELDRIVQDWVTRLTQAEPVVADGDGGHP